MKKILLLTIFLSSYSWSSDYMVCESLVLAKEIFFDNI